MVGFLEGYKIGADLGSKVAGGLEKRWDAQARKRIANAGLQDFSFEEDAPAVDNADSAIVQAGTMKAAGPNPTGLEAAANAAPAPAPAPAMSAAEIAGFDTSTVGNITPTPAPRAPAPAMSAADIAAMDTSQVGQMAPSPTGPSTPTAPNARGLNLGGSAAPAAAPTPAAANYSSEDISAMEESTKATKVKVANPLTDYEAYRAQARAAAEEGMLDLQKAYMDSAEKAWDKGISAFAGQAIAGVEKGDFKPLERMLNKYYPDGLSYKNISAAEDGTITYDQVGDKGETVRQTTTPLEMAAAIGSLTDPALRKQLFMANISAKQEEKIHARNRSEKLSDVKDDRAFQVDMFDKRTAADEARQKRSDARQIAAQDRRDARAAAVAAAKAQADLTKAGRSALTATMRTAGISDPMDAATMVTFFRDTMRNNPDMEPLEAANLSAAAALGLRDRSKPITARIGGGTFGNTGINLDNGTIGRALRARSEGNRGDYADLVKGYATGVAADFVARLDQSDLSPAEKATARKRLTSQLGDVYADFGDGKDLLISSIANGIKEAPPKTPAPPTTSVPKGALNLVGGALSRFAP